MSASAPLPPNAFSGEPKPPTDAGLASALGPAKPVWDDLLARLAAQCGIDGQEWKSYSGVSGWSLRLLRGKRTIVWLAPCQKQFRVAFILGDRALAAAHAAGLPDRILKLFDGAPRYPEGTGIRLHISSARELPAIVKLARIKMEN